MNALFTRILLCFSLLVILQCQKPERLLTTDEIWPDITREHKPWTRWWWMGNAVSKLEIEQQLEELANAGFGGVEITPIYGVQGKEDEYIEFLSDDWMEMLEHTIIKADELDMGVDMNLGTGWPFGGPHLSPEDASGRLLIESFHLDAGQKADFRIVSKDPRQNPEDLEFLAIMAYFEDGSYQDISAFLDEAALLNWIPEQNCEVVAAWNGKTRQKVKRAAPGGEGWTLDHYSSEALETYLSRFDSAFSKIEARPRSFFNDSYEVYGSTGTKEIFEEFQKRRGYDIKPYLRELHAKETSDTATRIQYDYRITFAELLMEEFTRPWKAWSNEKGVLTRNQAHGSPANIIDLYAATDIPECETFGSSFFPIPGLRRDSSDIRPVDPDPVMLKFATSAGNVYGKDKISSETFTWLAEHFKTSLSQCKPELEQIFLSGVNHVFYHGTTYSPSTAKWPGWLFYASVQFGPVNSFWPHIGGLNDYIATCQSILQSGKSDNDVLVYWPFHDTRHNVGKIDQQISIHNIDEWLYPTEFYRLSQELMEAGYLVDFATDEIISQLRLNDGLLSTSPSANAYKYIVVPTADFMPLATLKNLYTLAEQGAPIVFQELPGDVPGWHGLQDRRKELSSLKTKISKLSQNADNLSITPEIIESLKSANILPEDLTHTGLKFIRRKSELGTFYYLVNHSPNKIDDWISVRSADRYAVLLDANMKRLGIPSSQKDGDQVRYRIQLESGETVFLLCSNAPLSLPNWTYSERDFEPLEFNGSWQVKFLEGGPELPDPTHMDSLYSWTCIPQENAPFFSGLACYENTFEIENPDGGHYLNLGEVRESARVWINDQEVGILWSIPYQFLLDPYIHGGTNSIKIEVANLMANRIRYMDQQQIPWQIFHEINFVNIDYEPFDASRWEPMTSGLLGPIEISNN